VKLTRLHPPPSTPLNPHILIPHNKLAKHLVSHIVPFSTKMSPPSILTSFLSVQPLEPVLVFSTTDDAAYFQSLCKQGRILPNPQRSKWVFLPMPDGLLRVRTAQRGDVAYDFFSHSHARAFNESVRGLGKILQNSRDRPDADRTVYLGKQLK
jgi:hypothetical protein